MHDPVEVNFFEVLSRPCIDGRMTFLDLNIHTKHEPCSVEMRVERTTNKHEYIL